MLCGTQRNAPPLGVYEGAFASRNPYASIGSARAAGPVDLAMGRFGWVNEDTGEVFNTLVTPGALGVIVPRRGLWAVVYPRLGVWYLRAGKPVTVAATGDFFLRFPGGAYIGNPVYADPATGIAYAFDPGGFVLTKWQVVTNCPPGALAKVSPYINIGNP